MGPLLDLVAGEHGRQRQAGAEGLRQREDVGHDAVALEGEHEPGTADAGLRLVEHEEHPPLVAAFLQGRQVPRRQLEHTAGRQDRLGDERRQAADGLPVDEVEPVVELGRQSSAPSAVVNRGR